MSRNVIHHMEKGMSLSLRRMKSTRPDPKPSAAFEPRDTTVHTIITKASARLFWSRQAMASSTPAKRRRTPRRPIGNSERTTTNELPTRRPRIILVVPRRTTAAPLLAPNRVCPAKPPAPWHTGMAPNQQPTRFIRPTLVDTAVGVTNLSGNKSLESLHTAMTEFRMERGIWGMAPFTNPVFQSLHVMVRIWGVDGPRVRLPQMLGSRMNARTMPRKKTMSAVGRTSTFLAHCVLVLVLLLLLPFFFPCAVL